MTVQRCTALADASHVCGAAAVVVIHVGAGPRPRCEAHQRVTRLLNPNARSERLALPVPRAPGAAEPPQEPAAAKGSTP